MTVQWAGAPTWFSAFPFKQELGRFEGSTAFVDLRGGFGHQCIALREAFPDLARKLISQDLPQTLAQVPTIEGVEVMAHNLFEPQVVKGTASKHRFAFHWIRGLTLFHRRRILLPEKYSARLARRQGPDHSEEHSSSSRSWLSYSDRWDGSSEWKCSLASHSGQQIPR